MNCSTFRKRLNSLIEGYISYDLKDAMMEHMGHCSACRELYEEELIVEESFRKTLSLENITFTSPRINIMKSIDKNRYGKSPLKKLGFHFRRNKAIYGSLAALLVFGVFSGSYLYSYLSKPMPQVSVTENQNITISSPDKNLNLTESKKKPSAETPATKQTQGVVNSVNALNITFKKTEMNKDLEPKFASPWQSSPNGKLSACNEGRGKSGIEEGVGKIYVKDSVSGTKWSFELISDQRQDTPMSISWWDDEYLMVVVGYSQGTVSQGGRLYGLNITTGKVSEICEYRTADNKLDNKQQIISAERANNDITMNVIVYEDENYLKSHTESRKVINWTKDKFKASESAK